MLYIMRHGKTDWNAAYKIQGRTDIPLNDEGIAMAQKAQAQVDRIAFDCCYASPLSRAYTTAQIVLQNQNCPIIKDERLCEMSFGICEGDTRILENPDHLLYRLFRDPVHYIPVEGAESFAQLHDRCQSFLDTVILPQLGKDKNILIVAHGALNCQILGILRNTPLEHFWDNMTANCEMVLAK